MKKREKFVILILFLLILREFYGLAIKKEILLMYKNEKNIIIDEKDIRVKRRFNELNGFDNYDIAFIKKYKPKLDYFKIYDVYYGSFEDISFGLLYRAEKKYIIDKLIYDKSKGNDFEKLDKYIQDNKERIFKIFLQENYDDKLDLKIRIDMDIFESLDFNKSNNKFYLNPKDVYTIEDYIMKFSEESNPDYEYLRNERERMFFNKPIKYEDIDWYKYILFMGDYPALSLYVVENDNGNEWNKTINTSDDPKKIEELKQLYKEFEQFYNKETFTFAIR